MAEPVDRVEPRPEVEPADRREAGPEPEPAVEEHAWVAAGEEPFAAIPDPEPEPPTAGAPVAPATIATGATPAHRPPAALASVVRQLGVPAVLLVLVVVAALVVAGAFGGDDGGGAPPATTVPSTVPSDPSQLPSLDLP